MLLDDGKAPVDCVEASALVGLNLTDLFEKFVRAPLINAHGRDFMLKLGNSSLKPGRVFAQSREIAKGLLEAFPHLGAYLLKKADR
jgi:hypothetical protein